MSSLCHQCLVHFQHFCVSNLVKEFDFDSCFLRMLVSVICYLTSLGNVVFLRILTLGTITCKYVREGGQKKENKIRPRARKLIMLTRSGGFPSAHKDFCCVLSLNFIRSWRLSCSQRYPELEPHLSWSIISSLNSQLLPTSVSDLISFYQVIPLQCTNASNHQLRQVERCHQITPIAEMLPPC